MREMLFRGQRVDNGEWVESKSINSQIDVDGEEHIYIGLPVKSYVYPKMVTVEWVEVIPGTVGLYTGQDDKNGKKIFEGDIISSSWGYKGVVEFDRIIHAKLECLFNEDCEIIGNIHDNPEYLFGTDKT